MIASEDDDSAETKTSPVDATDIKLMSLLTEDGRLGNRAIGAALGLNEVTIAARIKSLRIRGILRVTAMCDWTVGGYDAEMWVGLTVESRSLAGVASRLAELSEVNYLLGTLGSFDLIAHVVTVDNEAAASFVEREIACLDGVQRISADVVLRTLKYEYKYHAAPMASVTPDLSRARIPLDEVDLAIVQALVVDGRTSNREIARQLGVSDGTIRTRLKRLECERLLRIVAQIDPIAARLRTSLAIVGLELRGTFDPAVQALQSLDEVPMVLNTSGQHQLTLFVLGASRRHLVDVINSSVRSLPQVTSAESWIVYRTYKYAAQWARLL